MKYNIFNILILFGVFQGAILIVLIQLFRYSKTNRFLQFLLFAFSLNTLKMMLFDIGYFNIYPRLFFFPFFFYLIGPSLYFYTNSLIGIQSKFKIIHFVPVILNTLYYLFGLIFYSHNFVTFHEKYFRFFEELFSLISVGIYIVLTLIKLKKTPYLAS